LIFLLLLCDLHALHVNLISQNNRKGLEVDRVVMKNALELLGHKTHSIEFTQERKDEHADINIFFEMIIEEWLPAADVNWFIPNPDHYNQDLALLDTVDLLLCRTREAKRIFDALNKPTYYLGFTSYDVYLPTPQKRYHHCFHCAGENSGKNTAVLVEAWKDDWVLPPLIALRYTPAPYQQFNLLWVDQWIPEKQKIHLQNFCGIHLCPSFMEGYGHTIVEGLSTGAIVIVPDGAPMNEHVTDPRCLIPATPYQARLATGYIVEAEDVRRVVENLMALPEEARETIGKRNRALYEAKTREFHKNLKILLDRQS